MISICNSSEKIYFKTPNAKWGNYGTAGDLDKMINDKIQEFMEFYKFEGLTFDDVSLVVKYADFLPDEVDVSGKFSRNIALNTPFVSAAMDTVTESKMAIAMAIAGGIGVIHKNLTIERQAEEVLTVKHYLNGLIDDPVVFRPDQTVAEMLDMKEKNNYSFSGFPIVEGGRIKGIITSRDIKFLTDYNVKLSEVMTRDLIKAPESTPLLEAFRIMIKNKIGKLPIVDKSDKLVGLYSFHDVKTLIENIEPNYNRDKEHRLRVAAAIAPYDGERADVLVKSKVDALVIDTAHGHSKGVIETVKMLKGKYGNSIDVIAGNIATGEGARALIDAGADALKVGIGPGSICTTRVVAGVGIPQLTSIYRVVREVGDEVPVIADGGVKQSGDIGKALAAGASSVMMGSLFAGTNESPGENIIHQGRTYVVYRGMGSLEAMKMQRGSRERYGQKDVDDEKKLVPQGIEGLVLYRGSVNDVIHQFAGGLRYALGYCGSKNLNEFRKNAEFVKVSNAGLKEAHPHDVKIIKDAPNYFSET